MDEVSDAERAAIELPARVTGECVYCEDTQAQFIVLPRRGKALRLRCEGCGFVAEVERD